CALYSARRGVPELQPVKEKNHRTHFPRLPPLPSPEPIYPLLTASRRRRRSSPDPPPLPTPSPSSSPAPPPPSGPPARTVAPASFQREADPPYLLSRPTRPAAPPFAGDGTPIDPPSHRRPARRLDPVRTSSPLRPHAALVSPTVASSYSTGHLLSRIGQPPTATHNPMHRRPGGSTPLLCLLADAPGSSCCSPPHSHMHQQRQVGRCSSLRATTAGRLFQDASHF
uniref:Uncharacterized protein n=1 Tax=Triticum urartu TaxID=4572 RepID=A0A8R7JXM0_TRIUA